jgi:hypothetical protein
MTSKFDWQGECCHSYKIPKFLKMASFSEAEKHPDLHGDFMTPFCHYKY